MAQSATASQRLALAAAFTLALLLGACSWNGSPPTTSSPRAAASASSARTASPTPSPQDIPDATRLTTSNCSGPAPNTATRPLGRYFTMRPAEHWTESAPPQQTESLLLELEAPNTYGFTPTSIRFHSLIGPVHTVYGQQATAHSIAQQRAAAIAQEWSPDAVAGAVSDCHIGGEPAAAFGVSGDLVTSSGTAGGKFIWIYVVHSDLLFEVILVGTGGISDQAIQDSLGMLGSVSWTF